MTTFAEFTAQVETWIEAEERFIAERTQRMGEIYDELAQLWRDPELRQFIPLRVQEREDTRREILRAELRVQNCRNLLIQETAREIGQ